MLWQHDSTKPIGIINNLKEDRYGLKIQAEINNNIRSGAEATTLVKQNALCGLSVGFIVKSSDYNKKGQRLIYDAKLMEVSIVTFPANQDAGIINIKSKTSPLQELAQLTTQLKNY